MSYFDFFTKNIESQISENDERILGTCYSMCPKVEVDLRVKEKMLHILEIVGSEKKLVKSYSRSAADAVMTVPQILRPYSVLLNTLQYLLFEVVNRVDVSTLVIYNFVDDRLRAIRQDMTIQRLPPSQCVCLLDPMIRFYVYYGYKLQGLPRSDFDPVLNKKYLLECMKWFLYCCDNDNQIHRNNIDELSVFVSKLDINKETLKCDRVLIESLYILCNLTDLHPLRRYLGLPKDMKSNTTLQLAYKISLANMKGNYIAVCRVMKNLCPLTYYALCLYLPEIQRQAVQVMSHAYNSKKLTVPLEVLQNWLHVSSKNKVKSICEHYGMTTQNDGVTFTKANFRTDVPLHNLEKYDETNTSLRQIFIYAVN